MNCKCRIVVPLLVVATVVSYQVKSLVPNLPDRPRSYFGNALQFPSMLSEQYLSCVRIVVDFLYPSINARVVR